MDLYTGHILEHNIPCDSSCLMGYNCFFSNDGFYLDNWKNRDVERQNRCYDVIGYELNKVLQGD